MAEDDWSERQRILASAGILVLASAKDSIQQIPDIQPLIEAARSSGLRMLDARSVEELLTLVPAIESKGSTNVTSRTEQATLPDPNSHSSHGRVVAPSSSLELAPSPRPHGLAHYDLAEFPMQARDVDAEIEVHFDITGHSVTEGA